MKITCNDKEGRALITIDVTKLRSNAIVTIAEASLVAVLAYEKPLTELEWNIPEDLYPKFEKELGWVPEEGKHDTLFSIKVNWVAKEANKA